MKAGEKGGGREKRYKSRHRAHSFKHHCYPKVLKLKYNCILKRKPTLTYTAGQNISMSTEKHITCPLKSI